MSGGLLGGLVLALAASVALNTSYVLQHRGSATGPEVTPRAPLATLRGLLASPWWFAGAVVGIAGWAMHVGALSAAPLSLVQAFVAGGLALAVPLAARVAGERLGGGEATGVALLVAALALLAVGMRAGPEHPAFDGAALAGWIAALGLGAGALAASGFGPTHPARRPAVLGLAGGLLYGAADMAIKALTGDAASGGLPGALTSPWLLAAAATTAAAFFCFQRGLQCGSAVPVIALMTAGTNVSSIAGGFLVFGDPFGRGPGLVAAHAAGLALVGVGAWRLAPAQARLTTAEAAPGGWAVSPGRPVLAPAVRAALALLAAVAAVGAGVGLVYLLRSAHILGLGPRVAGALPLQQLNGDAAQPLLRLLVAWIPAGAVAGFALVRLGRLPRLLAWVVAPVLGLVVLTLVGAESDGVVVDRSLGRFLGAQPSRPALWIAAACLGLGAVWARGLRRRGWAVPAALVLAAGVVGTASYAHNYWLYRGFPPPHDPPGVPAGKLVTRSFYSRALHQRRRFLAYLPPGYAHAAAAGRRFPVLYVLHAAPGRPDTTFKSGAIGVRADVGLARGRLRRMIIVIPYGKTHRYASDTEWANAGAGRFQSFVLDTVRAVDADFATIRSRRARALAGYSEGGYGAINVALHDLRTFGVAESWSGYFVQTPTAAFTGASAAALAANSPALYVPSLAGRLHRLPLHVFLYEGRHDDVTLASMLGFARRLRAAGGHVRTAVYPGRHTWRLWRGEMGQALRYASRHLK